MNRFFTLIAATAGIVAGIVNVYLVPREIEIGLWILLVVVLGALAQRYVEEKLFIRSFLYAAITGIFITIIHILLVTDYLASHIQERMAVEEYGMSSERLTLLVYAPIHWLMLGLLTGLSAVTWNKLRTD